MAKKLVLVSLVAVASRFVMSKIKAGQAEQTLWAEATDSVQPAR